MNTEFAYMSMLIEEFFLDGHISSRFAMIENNDISGWETWLQIEFSHFLSSHSSKPEWWREYSLPYDRRMEKEKSIFRPDFLIRKKGWKTESYMVLEIKQHPNPAVCLKNMLSDYGKILKMKKSALNMREVWVLGIFKINREQDLSEVLRKHVSLGIPNRFTTNFIGNTNFAYSLW